MVTKPPSLYATITETQSHSEYDRKWMETEARTFCQRPEFPNGGKAIVEQILASEEINKSKRAGLSELQSK